MIKAIVMFAFIQSSLAYAGPTSLDCDVSPLEEHVNNVLEATKKLDEGCAKEIQPKELCAAVGGSEKDLTGTHRFAYQRILYDFACAQAVSNNDPDKIEKRKVANKKIVDFWNNKGGKDITCNSDAFDFHNGNLLKLAVARKFLAFLTEAIYLKVDLNKVDEDGRTVLDYVDYLIERNEGNPANQEVFIMYRTMLERAKAKRNIDR